jgi:hypothetical protein
MSLNYESEFYRGGLLKTVKVKEMPYDLVEFTITTKLTDEVTGKTITDSGHTWFFDTKEFKEFFTPIINELKAKLDNDNANSIQN